jgi:inhibitor of cysteine peptidase
LRVPSGAALALVLAMSGCASTSESPLELTAEDSGTTQTLAVGQQMSVTLEANPTTGYSWAIDGALPQQLEQAGEPAYAAESDLVGAGGAETWTFRAASAGQGVLKLKYWRSFEPTVPPENAFEVTVNVE